MTRTDKTERKLITFTAQGAALLERMAGPPGRRAAGDYLSALLVQRWHMWRDAVSVALESGYTRASLRMYLEEQAGRGDTFAVRQPGTLALAILRQEWDAGNVALRAALKGDTK